MSRVHRTNRRRYVVIGAGAVGGALAAQLVEAGYAVLLVARGEHGRRIAAHGLLVRRPGGTCQVRMEVEPDPESVVLTPNDVLVLATKTQDAEAALGTWQSRPVRGGTLAADLPIVTFQNGLATEPAALRRFSRVYAATIGIAASYLTPGEIVSPSLPPTVGVIWIGRYPRGLDDLATSLVGEIRSAGFAAWAVEDVQQVKAAKLLANLANGLDLLEGDDDSRSEARDALRAEAGRVLAGAGIALPPGGGLDLHGTTLTVLPVAGHTPGRLSTWQSHARGASSEIDYLNGEIVLLGRLHGVPTPVNARLQRLLVDPSASRTLDALLGVLERVSA